MKTVEEIKMHREFLKGKLEGFEQSRVCDASEKMCIKYCIKELDWVLEDGEDEK